jgi:hypothetical protein
MVVGSLSTRLPDWFPEGTRYVVEGRGDERGSLRIHLRYLEFPDGRQVPLPADGAAGRGGRRRRRGRRNTARK